MTVDEIRELINLARETGVAELEVQRGDFRVRIRLGGSLPSPSEILISGSSAPATGPHPPLAYNPAMPPPAAEVSKAKAEKPPDPNLFLVKAPIVGTFYECPSPGAPPFVNPGDRVTPGKVLCIIESMKLMNEIEAETSGILESRLVLNGQPVEYGEALFAIRTI